jgi:hypothetical protein
MSTCTPRTLSVLYILTQYTCRRFHLVILINSLSTNAWHTRIGGSPCWVASLQYIPSSVQLLVRFSASPGVHFCPQLLVHVLHKSLLPRTPTLLSLSCTYRPSVIYLIVKNFSLSLSLSTPRVSVPPFSSSFLLSASQTQDAGVFPLTPSAPGTNSQKSAP